MPNKVVTVRRWELVLPYLIVVLVSGYGLHLLHRNDRAQCMRLEQVRAYAYSAADRGMQTLPTLTYYKQHPDELARQLKELANEKQYFAPVHCP